MGVVLREKGLLKLVHPGGFVEMHKQPVRAGKIMQKNPRHLVTRPDVFKFPWIVVRPESLLIPGYVFYVVPYHTIHRLLQEKHPHPPKLYEQESRDFYQKAHETSINETVGVLKSCLRNKERHQYQPSWKKYRRVTFLLPDEGGPKKLGATTM